jgi:hypothetical protein
MGGLNLVTLLVCRLAMKLDWQGCYDYVCIVCVLDCEVYI